MAVVTFTTDFGLSDAYVGAMKGVVLGIAPSAVLVDITHAVPAQNVQAGALALADASSYFPAGSVHVAVVDPGVGGDRHGIAVASRGHYFVGPDNGLLSLAVPKPRRVFLLESPLFRRATVSPTFHGRDVFAVAAGQLAAGRRIEEAGRALDTMIELPIPAMQALSEDCRGEILTVDHFGNLLTGLSSVGVEGKWELVCGGRRFALDGGRTFSDVAPGALVLYVGSSGRVEVALRDGSAALLTQAKAGTQIHLKRLS
jgi:S-adenosylmethionine hydrolase